MSEPFQTDAGNYKRDKTGIVVITLTYPIEVLDASEPWDTLDTWEPTFTPLDLPVVDRQASKRDGKFWDLTLTFEGARNPGALGAFAEIDHASVTSPIESFEFFDLLVKKFKGSIVDGKFEGFAPKIKDEVTGESIKNPAFGVKTFDEDSCILRVTFGLKDFRSELFDGMSKIWTPLVPYGMAYLKDLPDGQTWRKRKVKALFRGNVWQFEIESEAGKWSPDIYREKNSAGQIEATGGVNASPPGLDQKS